MSNQKFIVNITQEQANNLQRIGMDLDSKVFIIDRMFGNHAMDTDIQLFESIPFKHYIKEYEKAYLAWETAKNEFEKTVLTPMVKEKTKKENPVFNWEIKDYLSLQCEIAMVE